MLSYYIDSSKKCYYIDKFLREKKSYYIDG